MRRSPALSALSTIILLTLMVSGVSAKTSWVSVKDVAGADDVCLELEGRQFNYTALSSADVATCVIHGQRRLKILSRYVFAEGDLDRVPYSIIVTLDGREVLRKGYSAKLLEGGKVCSDDSRVGTLRKDYLDIPTGRHELSIRAESEGDGIVATRLFRQVKTQKERWVPFAPEGYESLRQLQFESGNQSTYYHFDATTPLNMSVNGPTTLRVRTRLDFEHTMNGSQTYALEVMIDGEVYRTFHFDSDKLSTAIYLESPDILPGNRRELRISVPRGMHGIEIRCVRPEACGVAAMIHIPKSDLER